MISKKMYDMFMRDIQKAYLSGEFTTEQWIKSWQGIAEAYKNEHGQDYFTEVTK